MSDHDVWVRVNAAGIIGGAAVDDGTDGPIRFLGKPKKGERVFRMPGPVRMSAHFTNPMVYPAEPLPQVELPEAAANLLRDNLWDLYE